MKQLASPRNVYRLAVVTAYLLMLALWYTWITMQPMHAFGPLLFAPVRRLEVYCLGVLGMLILTALALRWKPKP